MVDRAELQQAVHDYLRGFEQLADVRTKDVRMHLQNKFKLPDNYFTGEFKEELLGMITSFSKQNGSKTSEAPTSEHGDTFKEGRFSKEESSVVMECAKQYVAERGLKLEDICTTGRTKGENENNRHLEFWREVQRKLPHRKRDAIWHHAQRILARPVTGSGKFTVAEKAKLEQLVKVHGRNFVLIGGLMGRLPDDCQQVLIRMSRKVSGRFTEVEDADIVTAVQEALNMPGVHPADLPSTRLPWAAVAAKLNNARLALDYRRRWPVIVRNATVDRLQQRVEQEGEEALSAAVAHSLPAAHGRLSIDGPSLTARRLQLLNRLIESGYTDESEVNWAQLDRDFNYINNTTLHRWRSMQKLVPKEADGEEASFEEQLQFLHDKFSKEASAEGSVEGSGSGSASNSGGGTSGANGAKGKEAAAGSKKQTAKKSATAATAATKSKAATKTTNASIAKRSAEDSDDDSEGSQDDHNENSDSSSTVLRPKKKPSAASPSPAASPPAVSPQKAKAASKKGMFSGPVFNAPKATGKGGKAGKADKGAAAAGGSDEVDGDDGDGDDDVSGMFGSPAPPVAQPTGPTAASAVLKQKASQAAAAVKKGPAASQTSTAADSDPSSSDHSSSARKHTAQESDAEADLEEIFSPENYRKPSATAAKGKVKGADEKKVLVKAENAVVESDLSDDGPDVHELSSEDEDADSREGQATTNQTTAAAAATKLKSEGRVVKGEGAKDSKAEWAGKAGKKAETERRGNAPLSIEQMYADSEGESEASHSSQSRADRVPAKVVANRSAPAPAAAAAVTPALFPVPTQSAMPTIGKDGADFCEGDGEGDGAGTSGKKKKKKNKRKKNRKRGMSTDSDDSDQGEAGLGMGKVGAGAAMASGAPETAEKRKKRRGKRGRSSLGAGVGDPPGTAAAAAVAEAPAGSNGVPATDKVHKKKHDKKRALVGSDEHRDDEVAADGKKKHKKAKHHNSE